MCLFVTSANCIFREGADQDSVEGVFLVRSWHFREREREREKKDIIMQCKSKLMMTIIMHLKVQRSLQQWRRKKVLRRVGWPVVGNWVFLIMSF